jgi:hypothetical protein
MELLCKAFSGAVEVKDVSQGLVEAVVGRVGVMDLEGDVFLPGAFGERPVRVSSYNHRSWPSRGGLPPVGKGRIFERGDEVRAEIQFFLSTTDGREAFEQVKQMGELQEWSYGWLPGTEKQVKVTDAQREKGVRRSFVHVPVAEVSPVLLGASIGTKTMAVKCDACQAKADGEAGDDEPPPKEESPELRATIEAEVARARELLERAGSIA